MREAGGWRTLQAMVVRWSDTEVAARAAERASSGAYASWQLFVKATGCGRESSPASRVLVDRPHRRILITSAGGAPSVQAADGRRRWERSGNDYLLPDVGSGGGITVARSAYADLIRTLGGLVAPGALTRALDLSVTGADCIDGRPVVVLRGIPRRSAGAGLWGEGANGVRLWVQRRTGTVLQLESLVDGRPFERVTLRGLRVDAAIPRRRFAFAPPPGARVLHARDLLPSTLPPRQAAARVAFGLFAPAAGGPNRFQLSPGYGQPSPEVSLSLPAGITITERSAATASDCIKADARRIELPGIPAVVVAERAGVTVVRVVRDGTAIDVSGRARPEALAAVGASLEPLH
jgi:hypothetical protein